MAPDIEGYLRLQLYQTFEENTINVKHITIDKQYIKFYHRIKLKETIICIENLIIVITGIPHNKLTSQ